MGLFSGSISAWIVLSHNPPEINTKSKLALFCAFYDRDLLRFTFHWPLTTVLVLLGHHSPATRHSPLAAGRKLGLFSGSNSAWIVLSHNMPETNTKSKLALFCAFYDRDLLRFAFHWPLTTCHKFSCYGPPFSRHSPLAAGRKLGSFSGSNSAWFDLSHNMPEINTKSKLALFFAFLSPPTPYLRIHWPLCFRPTPHAPRCPGQRVQALHRNLPRWLLPDTDRRLRKTERGPIPTNEPSILSMSQNQAIRAEKSIRFPGSPPPNS